MIRELNKPESIYTSNFGGFCPFWTKQDQTVYVADTAEEIFNLVPESDRTLNTSSFFELMFFNYILGDNTLIKDVYRMPWHSELSADGVIKRRAPIVHGKNQASAKEIAMNLQNLLREEILNVSQNVPTIYLLLTGGLDSRVVAGILKKIEEEINSEIKCVTWGQDNSRDLAYAKRIASWYDWEFIHIPYTPELLWDNINRGAIWGGSEVAGIHLHGMSWFENVNKNDLVLAASFGDSIGRAEFSSVHLADMNLPNIFNKHRLMHPSLVENLIQSANDNRESAWRGEASDQTWVKCELDQQENYMRRMLVHVMDYIRKYAEVHQSFTSDNVVKYMWSLSPESRTDDVYFELLKDLDLRLYSLPWARNGIAPDGAKETDMSLTKNYHVWEKWMRTDLKEKLEPLYFSKGIEELNIFNPIAKKHLWTTWQKEGPDAYGKGQDIVKICSLELSRQNYNIKGENKKVFGADLALDMIKYVCSRIF